MTELEKRVMTTEEVAKEIHKMRLEMRYTHKAIAMVAKTMSTLFRKILEGKGEEIL